MQLGERYLAELIVEPDSSWIGKEVNPEIFERDFDVDLIGVLRAGQALPIGDLLFAPYDSLLVRGPLEHVLKLTAQNGLALHRPNIFTDEEKSGADDEKQEASFSDENGDNEQKESNARAQLAEVVVLTTSGLVGRTLDSATSVSLWRWSLPGADSMSPGSTSIPRRWRKSTPGAATSST